MALRYFLNNGTAWNSNTNWSTTDGGVSGATYPTSADTAYFTSNSGPCTITGVNAAVGSLYFSGATAYNKTFNVISFGVNLYGIGGNAVLFLSPNMTVTGSTTGCNTQPSVTACTITSNGTPWNGYFQFLSGISTVTYTDAMVFNGPNVYYQNGGTSSIASTLTFNNGFQVNTSGQIGTFNGGTVYIKGGTWQGNGSINGTSNFIVNNTTISTFGPSFANNLTFAGTGTTTFANNFNIYTPCTLTYTSGNIITTGGVLNIVGSTTLQTSGMSWNNVSFNNAPNITLLSNLNVYNTLTINGTAGTTFTGGTGLLNFTSGGTVTGSLTLSPTSGVGAVLPNDCNVLDLTITCGSSSASITVNNINVYRNFTCNGSQVFSSPYSAPFNVNMVGTGNVTTTAAAGIDFWVNINTTGTTTFTSGSTFAMRGYPAGGFRQSGFKYSAGTVVVQSGHIFSVPTAGTVNLNIDSGPIIWSNFNLSAGISIPTNGTVNIGNSFTTLAGISTAAAHISITGTTGSKLNLLPGATQNLEYLNGTNIDSSGGQTILTYKGVISGTNNWALLSTQPATVVSTFIR